MESAGLLWGGFYFCFHSNAFNPERDHYAQMALANGLSRLGAPLFSNIPAPPFIAKPPRPEDGHTFIFEATRDSYTAQVASAIAQFPAPRKVIMSMDDAAQWLPTAPDMPALFPHGSRYFTLPGTRFPWPFGLTDDRLAACGEPPPFETRRPVILRNFRPSYPQAVRGALDLSLVPHLQKHFTIDRAVSANTPHHRGLGGDHFERLRTSIACLAYCGEFAVDLSSDPGIMQGPMGALYRVARFTRDPVVARWDSWRFWESLACGCLTFHVDLEKYGCALPEMPVAWKHYIPIDLEEPRAAVERFMDEKPRWPEIAAAGRAWVLQHYSPDAAVARFLRLLTGHWGAAPPAPPAAAAPPPAPWSAIPSGPGPATSPRAP